jgi:hypothetical protein
VHRRSTEKRAVGVEAEWDKVLRKYGVDYWHVKMFFALEDSSLFDFSSLFGMFRLPDLKDNDKITQDLDY